MNVCEVPDVCKNMEYKLVTEDSKTRVYVSLVREFNEKEYEKYYLRKGNGCTDDHVQHRQGNV